MCATGTAPSAPSQGRSEAHLKVWAACDDTGAPQAFLVGSANLTIAGLHENVELMALADASEHAYLRSTLQQLQDKSWDAKERLEEWIEHGDSSERSHRPTRHRSDHTPSTRGKQRQHAPAASTGCGSQVLASGVPDSGRSRSAHWTEQASTLIQRSGVAAERHSSSAHAGHRPRVLSRRRRSTRSTRLAVPLSDPVAVFADSAPHLTCPFAAPHHQPPTTRG